MGLTVRFSKGFTAALLMVFSLSRARVALADSTPLQRELKTYALPIGTQSADISPDEQVVATLSTKALDEADSKTKTITGVVRLWDFKAGKQLAEFAAQKSEKTGRPGGNLIDASGSVPVVRFTADGQFVLALIGQTIHVLLAANLTELRGFSLDAPGDITRAIPGHRTVVHEPSVRSMEISPNGEVVAVLWVTHTLYGRVQLYDLSSGRSGLSWNTPQGWVYFTKRLVWHPDGTLLLLAIPSPSPNSQPDVFAFDVQTGILKYKLRTGLLTGGIAVSPDNRVLAVDLNCLGVFKNHDPELKVFDLRTGKHLQSIPARETGPRYEASTSADGSRFLALTGKMAVKFDWSDVVPFDTVVDETFSVWNLMNYKGIVTSQNIPGLKQSELRLSSRGKYAVSYGKASFVYELP